MLADAEVQHASVRVALPGVRGPGGRDEGRRALNGGVVGLGQVSGAAPEFGHDRADRVQHLARSGAGRDVLAGLEDRQGRIEFGRELPGLDAFEQGRGLGVAGLPGLEAFLPLGPGGSAAVAYFPGVGQNVLVHLEGTLRVEAEDLLQAGDFLGTQGRAVDLAGVLLLRGRVADDGPQRDDGGLGGFGLRREERLVQLGDVLDVVPGTGPVNALGVPAVGFVAAQDVFGERHVGVVLDRDVVLVVNHHEVAEFLVSGQGGGLGGHALLQVAVGGDDPDRVVEGARAGGGVGVEQPAHPPLGVSETDGGGQALAQRAGRDLHALGVLVLRVARRQRIPGPQSLQVLQFQAVAGEEELDVQGQGGVARRQDEPVPAQPVRVRRIVPHQLLEQQVRGRGQAHRRARVAVTDLLHRIRGQHPDGVHRTLVQIGPRQFLLFQMWHENRAPLCADGRRYGPLAPGTVWCPLRSVPAVHHRNVDLSFRRRSSYGGAFVGSRRIRADLQTA